MVGLISNCALGVELEIERKGVENKITASCLNETLSISEALDAGTSPAISTGRQAGQSLADNPMRTPGQEIESKVSGQGFQEMTSLQQAMQNFKSPPMSPASVTEKVLEGYKGREGALLPQRRPSKHLFFGGYKEIEGVVSVKLNGIFKKNPSKYLSELDIKGSEDLDGAGSKSQPGENSDVGSAQQGFPCEEPVEGFKEAVSREKSIKQLLVAAGRGELEDFQKVEELLAIASSHGIEAAKQGQQAKFQGEPLSSFIKYRILSCAQKLEIILGGKESIRWYLYLLKEAGANSAQNLQKLAKGIVSFRVTSEEIKALGPWGGYTSAEIGRWLNKGYQSSWGPWSHYCLIGSINRPIEFYNRDLPWVKFLAISLHETSKVWLGSSLAPWTLHLIRVLIRRAILLQSEDFEWFKFFFASLYYSLFPYWKDKHIVEVKEDGVYWEKEVDLVGNLFQKDDVLFKVCFNMGSICSNISAVFTYFLYCLPPFFFFLPRAIILSV